MIKFLWIAIAALGCWNVYHRVKQHWDKLSDAVQDEVANREESDRMAVAGAQKLRDDLTAEIEKRERLEEMIGKYIAGPQPVVLNMEAIYQAMCNRAAMEGDPDSIIRQAEGKDWEGGCGHS